MELAAALVLLQILFLQRYAPIAAQSAGEMDKNQPMNTKATGSSMPSPRTCEVAVSVNIEHIPRGCEFITMDGACHGNEDLKLYSTADWRQRQTGVRYTDGVVYAGSKTILSISGATVTKVGNSFEIQSSSGEVDSNDVTVSTTSEDNCVSFPTCANNLIALESGFKKTLLAHVKLNLLPSWLGIPDTTGITIVITRLLSGATIDSTKKVGDYRCDIGTLVDTDSWYIAVILEGTFEINEQSLYVKNLCLLIDVCTERRAFYSIPFNEEFRQNIEHLEFFNRLTHAFGVGAYPKTLLFSLLESDPERRKRSTDVTTFWNGNSLFEPGPITNPAVSMIAKLSKNTELFGISGDVEFEIDLPDINQMLTGFGVAVWKIRGTIHLDASSVLKYELFGIPRTIPLANLAPNGLEFYGDFGGTDGRMWCGENANPPGIFIAVKTDISPFSDVAELNNLIVDADNTFYAHWTTKQNSRLNTLVQIDIKNQIDGLLDFIQETFEFVQTIANLIEVSAVLTNLTSMKNEINTYNSQVPKTDPTTVHQFIGDLWLYFRLLDRSVRTISVDAADNEQDKVFADVIKDDRDILRGLLNNVDNMFTEQVLTRIPDYTRFDYKFTADFGIFDLIVPGIIAEFGYSTDTDNQFCEIYQNTEQLLPNTTTARLQGRVSSKKTLGQFLTAQKDSRIRSAFAINSQEFLLTFSPTVNFLGLNEVTEVTITRNGLSFALITARLYDRFLASLEIKAAHSGEWSQLNYKVKGNFVDGHPDSFQNSLKTELERSALYVQDVVSRRIIEPKNALLNSQNALSIAKVITQNRQNDVEEALEKLRQADSDLEKAERRVSEALGPYNIALANLEAAQIDIQQLCMIRPCPLLCRRQYYCRPCFRYITRFRFPCRSVCCRSICVLYYIDPFCVTYNALCQKCRVRAYVALAIAQGFVSIALTDYEENKVTRDVAQQRQRSAATALENAQNALEIAQIVQLAAEILVETSTRLLQIVENELGSAVKVANYTDNNAINSIASVGDSVFDINLSNADREVVDLDCTMNVFGLGDKRFLISLNFLHVNVNLWETSLAIVDAVSSDINESVRTKRSALPKRVSRRATNEFDVRTTTLGLTGNITTDYDNRVVLFEYKCAQTTIIDLFLLESFQALFILANETVTLRDIAIADTSSSQPDSFDVNALTENLTLDSAGIDTEYAVVTFNLSLTELNNALQEVKTEIASDQLIGEINHSLQDSDQGIETELELAETFQLIPQWINAMENSTENYFNETQCTKFEDCVHYAVSEYFRIMTNEEVPELENILNALDRLDKSISTIFQNVSVDIQSTHNISQAILGDIMEIEDLNPFCARAPTLAIEPVDMSLLEGATLLLICQANGDPEPSYWWKKDGVLLDVNLDRFVLVDVKVEDSGSYACVAGNYVANITSRQAIVSVTEPTTTTETPTTVTTSEDTTPTDSSTTSTFSISPTPTLSTSSAASTRDLPLIAVIIPVTVAGIIMLLLVATLIIRFIRKTGVRRSGSQSSSLTRDHWRPGIRYAPEDSLLSRSVASDEEAPVKASEFFRWENPYGWGR